jgi:hypothetical protein
MHSLIMFLLWAFPGQTECQPGDTASYLYQPSYCIDDLRRLPARPYQPQAGDIFLGTDKSKILQWAHVVAGSKGVHHSGIVVAGADGRLALLEGGPQNTLRCKIVDLIPELCHYECQERVWIRRRRCPLTPEQNAALTCFACRQDGKRFALWRMLNQLTPMRARGPFINCFGGPHGERDAYFCSELATEACVFAGLMDPCHTRPAATYPRDIFLDDSGNRFLAQHQSFADGWYPPARWTSGSVMGAADKTE